MTERPPIQPHEIPGGNAAGAEIAHHGGGPFQDGSTLIQPIEARRAIRALPASNRQMMRVTCPRCALPFVTVREYRPLYCVADEPPYIGEGRGCGWLLMVLPKPGILEDGDAIALVDCEVNADTGMGSRSQQRRGLEAFAEQVNRRGLVKKVFDLTTGGTGFEIRSCEELGI